MSENKEESSGELVAAQIVGNLIVDGAYAEAIMPCLVKTLDVDLSEKGLIDIDKMQFPQSLSAGNDFASIKSHPKGIEVFLSDMLINSVGVGGLEPYCYELSKAVASKVDSAILAEVSDLVVSSGKTNTPLTEATFLDALYKLEEARAEHPLVCVLHSKQINELREDIIQSSGTMWAGASAAMADLGAFASLYGVDMFKSIDCPTINAGVDRQGVMMPVGNQSGLGYILKTSLGDIKRSRSKRGVEIIIEVIYNDECIDTSAKGGVAIFSKA